MTTGDHDVTFFPAASALTGAELLYLAQGGVDYATTVDQLRSYANAHQPGQCVLQWSSSTLLKLLPHKGNLLTVNGLARSIPDAGITMDVSGLSGSTNYYIYAWMNGATMTLEASTTAPLIQSGTGIRVKTSDASRTLVGFARTNSTPNWFDSITVRWTRSWFNEKPVILFGGNNGSTSTVNAWVDLNGSGNLNFLAWGGENWAFRMNGSFFHSVAGTMVWTEIAVDGVRYPNSLIGVNPLWANYYTPVACETVVSGLSEAQHTMTIQTYQNANASVTYAVDLIAHALR